MTPQVHLSTAENLHRYHTAGYSCFLAPFTTQSNAASTLRQLKFWSNNANTRAAASRGMVAATPYHRNVGPILHLLWAPPPFTIPPSCGPSPSSMRPATALEGSLGRPNQVAGGGGRAGGARGSRFMWLIKSRLAEHRQLDSHITHASVEMQPAHSLDRCDGR